MVSTKNIILDQGTEWECACYATLNCLELMKPWIDIKKILEEMRPDFNKILTHIQAWKWLKEHGYIKDFVPYRYNPLLAHKIPVVARLFGVDWVNTAKPPYNLTMGAQNKNAHYVCVSKGKIENSWWSDWWDNGFCYFTPEQAKNLSAVRRIIL